jgi:hypothetical protein
MVLHFLDGSQISRLLGFCMSLTNDGVGVGSEIITATASDGFITGIKTSYSDQSCQIDTGNTTYSIPTSYQPGYTYWGTLSDNTTISIPFNVDGTLTL